MAKKEQIQTVEEKLRFLYELQQIDSKIDEIKVLRGELPLQIEDLKVDIKKIEDRKERINEEVKELKTSIVAKENSIKESEELIARYEEQQNNVRNNREFDSLSKEIEFQTLEIELSQKRIREYKEKLDSCKLRTKSASEELKDKHVGLAEKESELSLIVSETQKEEGELLEKSKTLENNIEEKLLTKYKALRQNMKNGLAVAVIGRDACGGCFCVIPPQRKLDIANRNKIIICEHCGRILVDSYMGQEKKSDS